MTSIVTTGAVPVVACVYRFWPIANDVNTTGMCNEAGEPSASASERSRRSVRSGVVLPSLKRITPLAPAASALVALVPKVHVPSWISAMWPGTKPAKSAGSHPLADDGVGVGVGGMTVCPTVCTAAVAVGAFTCPGLNSLPTTKVVGVGETTLNAGVPTKVK